MVPSNDGILSFTLRETGNRRGDRLRNLHATPEAGTEKSSRTRNSPHQNGRITSVLSRVLNLPQGNLDPFGFPIERSDRAIEAHDSSDNLDFAAAGTRTALFVIIEEFRDLEFDSADALLIRD